MNYPISEKIKKLILITVFALGTFLIIFHFTDTPNVWGDEGVFTETAKNLALHGVMGLQTAPGQFFSMRNFLLSTSYPVIFPVALSFKLFGTGLWQARLPMIVYMFVLIVLFYLFVRKKYGFYPAILSVLMIISFSPFYGNGRPVQGEVPGLVFLVLGLLLLLYLEENNFKNKKLAILSGLAFGLSASTKPIYLVVLSVSLFITLFFLARKPENRKTIYFLALGFIMPVILWIYVHIPTIPLFFIFISKSLYLASNHDASSVPVTQTIIHNFLRFFTESTPILFTVLFIGVISYLSFNFFKNKISNISITERIVVIFILINWLTYLVGTGWYRYFFPAHVLLYLLFPTAILSLSKVLKNKIAQKVLFIIPIALILFQFYYLVFLSDTSYVVPRDRNTELAETLSKIDSSKKVLFYNAIETTVFLRGNNYSQYLLMGDFLEAGDKDVLRNPDFDYILTNGSESDTFLSCYDKTSLSQYSLFQRRTGCQNPKI